MKLSKLKTDVQTSTRLPLRSTFFLLHYFTGKLQYFCVFSVLPSALSAFLWLFLRFCHHTAAATHFYLHLCSSLKYEKKGMKQDKEVRIQMSEDDEQSCNILLAQLSDFKMKRHIACACTSVLPTSAHDPSSSSRL